MHNKFISLIVSAAIAVTGIAAQPAKADNDDIAKWIAGLAAVAIIGAAIAENNRSKSKPAYARTQQPQQYKYLPAECQVNKHVHGQKVKGLSQSCLRRSNVNVQALPRDCAITLRNQGQSRDQVIYGGRCLYGHGYRLAGN